MPPFVEEWALRNLFVGRLPLLGPPPFFAGIWEEASFKCCFSELLLQASGLLFNISFSIIKNKINKKSNFQASGPTCSNN